MSRISLDQSASTDRVRNGPGKIFHCAYQKNGSLEPYLNGALGELFLRNLMMNLQKVPKL